MLFFFSISRGWGTPKYELFRNKFFLRFGYPKRQLLTRVLNVELDFRIFRLIHVARMGKKRRLFSILVGRPDGKRSLGRPRRRSEDNIRRDLREVGVRGENWLNVAQNRIQ